MFGDDQGSATVMMQVTLDASGAMFPAAVTDPVSRNAYTPYGAVRGEGTSAENDQLSFSKGWLNQITDEASTGLVYLNARYYDAGTSRFVSPDPLMNPADPRTLDAFRYAENNPVTYSDVTGLCSTTGSWAYVGGVLEPPCNTSNNTKGKPPRYDDNDYAPPKTPDWNHGDSGWQGTGGGATRHSPADPSVLNYLASLGVYMDANGQTSCETQACMDSGANYWAPGAAMDGGNRDRSGPGFTPDPVWMFFFGDDIEGCGSGSGWSQAGGCAALGMNFIPGGKAGVAGAKGSGKLLKWLKRILGHGDEAASVMRSLDDLGSLRGATPADIRQLIPEGWTEMPLKTGSGTRFVNPKRPGEAIMIENGWPGATDPLHSGPYLRVSRDGTVTRVPLQGNPVLDQ